VDTGLRRYDAKAERLSGSNELQNRHTSAADLRSRRQPVGHHRSVKQQLDQSRYLQDEYDGEHPFNLNTVAFNISKLAL
jgi:hypothetical protein